jgi:hypothetical protein
VHNISATNDIGQLAGALHLAEQLDGLRVPGARPPTPRGGQQPPAQLLGIADRDKLLERHLAEPQHQRSVETLADEDLKRRVMVQRRWRR